MKFSFFLTALLSSITFASSSGLYKRANYQTVISDLKTLKADLIGLNTTIAGFQGGGLPIVTAADVLSATNKVKNQLDTTISDVNASPQFGKKTIKVAIAVSGLTPIIFSVLDETIAKKPDFDHAILGVVSLSSMVYSNLKKQKMQSDELGAALVKKFASVYKSAVPPIQKEIDDHFKQAIRIYAGSGLIGRNEAEEAEDKKE